VSDQEKTMTEPQHPSIAPLRWGGVVWGALLALFAAAVLFVLSSRERIDEVGGRLASLTPGSAWALAAAVVGLVIVVSAVLGGIRASQRRRIRPGL
jgi:CDP-diglyceride synthetase